MPSFAHFDQSRYHRNRLIDLCIRLFDLQPNGKSIAPFHDTSTPTPL